MPTVTAPWWTTGALGAWWWQGLRTLLAMPARWPSSQDAGWVRPTPGLVAVLALVGFGAGVLANRLLIVGPAQFDAQALLEGWLPLLVAAWACWLAGRERPAGAGSGSLASSARLDVAALLALLCAQALPATLLGSLILVPLYRAQAWVDTEAGRWAAWGIWLGLLVWRCLAQLLVLWRHGSAPAVHKLLAVAVLAAASAWQWWRAPVYHWYPIADEQAASFDEDEQPPLRLKQEDIEVQAGVLNQQLHAMGTYAAAHPNQEGLYAITFAPYASEDVFMRESDLVASLMQQRFGAHGRTIQLVNHRDTLKRWPWATPLNLQRTIRHVGALMQRDRDVLFMHLTSHGASGGELAAEFAPLEMAPVTPMQLRRWLDEAGIRWRVISISACFSGSWIPALADDHTLVMTAADADHTSYGCGRRSPLTFFGRAMYDEQLRQHLSFERAHAAARTVIAQREREAGKDDGYSNPQMHMGQAIRARLRALEQALAH